MVSGVPPNTPTNDSFTSHASPASSSSTITDAVASSQWLQSTLSTGGPSPGAPSLPDQIAYLLSDELTNTSLLLSKHRSALWSSLLEAPLRSLERSSDSNATSATPTINPRELREGLSKFEKELTGRYHEQMEMLKKSLRRRAEAAVVEWEESSWGRVLEHVQELENRVERTTSVMKKPIPLPDERTISAGPGQGAAGLRSQSPPQGAWRYDELVVEVQQQRSRIAMLTDERARLVAEVAEERQRAKNFENSYQVASDGLADLRQELGMAHAVVEELKQQLGEEKERRKGSERLLGEERQESRVLKQTLALKGRAATLGPGELVFNEGDIRDMEDELLGLRAEVRRYQDLEAYERDRGEVRMAGRRRAESLYEEEDRRARAARRESKDRAGRGSPLRSEQPPRTSRSASHSHARRGSYDSAMMLQQAQYPPSTTASGPFDTNGRRVQFAAGI